jgi:hypothetical protein
MSSESAERSIYFHEDDYCQIELLPVSARQHCATQMGLIDDFAAKHSQGGAGYSDIYVRPDAPHSFAELRVAPQEFAAALQPHLPAYDAVFTGYSSHQERCQNALAWGDDSFTLFANGAADIIQNVWLDFGPLYAADAARMISVLRALPGSDRILIADWSWSLIAVLSDEASLDEYFRQRIGED